MMHKAMTDYYKVIIVLSKGYKEKADNFKSGVGQEYQLIINDIIENTTKYILVSFEGIPNDIKPLNFITGLQIFYSCFTSVLKKVNFYKV